MKKILLLILSFAMTLSSAFAKDKVLLITGENNHAWQRASLKMKKMLEDTGYEVDYCVDAAQLDKDSFKNIKVIVSFWNSWNKGPTKDKYNPEREAKFSKETREAYTDAVRNGAGHVMIHAGSCSGFPDWKEYKEITLATWKLGQTGHGKPYSFKVIPIKEHPITKGMPEMMTSPKEELWNKVGITADGVEIIIDAINNKGENQSYGMVKNFGKGRCYALFLGDNETAMDEVFKSLFIRGVQWTSGSEPSYPFPASRE